MERLFAAGARDVTLTPIIMKKGRPAITLAVIADDARREEIAAVIFAETSTIGLRFHPVARLKMHRETREVETQWGKIRVKFSSVYGNGNSPATVSPEYDDCREAARRHGAPLRDVMDAARDAARSIVASNSSDSTHSHQK
jgi:uncharacterized protein (DUF111 family)